MARFHEKYSAKTGLTTQVPYTAEEETEADARTATWISGLADRKLARIRGMRLGKLKETDWYSNSDVIMPDYIETWRQSLRDIPANYATESKYDELLEKDSDGLFIHSIWTQPTS